MSQIWLMANVRYEPNLAHTAGAAFQTSRCRVTIGDLRLLRSIEIRRVSSRTANARHFDLRGISNPNALVGWFVSFTGLPRFLKFRYSSWQATIQTEAGASVSRIIQLAGSWTNTPLRHGRSFGVTVVTRIWRPCAKTVRTFMRGPSCPVPAPACSSSRPTSSPPWAWNPDIARH